MLKIFRKYKSSIVGIAVSGFIAMLMLGFGLGSYLNKAEKQETFAAKVDDETVSYREFYTKRKQLEQRYRQQLGDYYNQALKFINFGEQTSDIIVNGILLSRFLDKLELVATDRMAEDRIKGNILSVPAFKNELSARTYGAYLRAIEMTGSQLEKEVKKELRVNQFDGLLRDASLFSEREMEAAHREKNTSFMFRYAKLPASRFEETINVSDEKPILQYYEDNKETYRKQPSVKYAYVEFAPTKFKKDVEILQEDLESRYNQRKHEFKTPTKYHVRQIMVRKAPPKEEEKSELEKLVTKTDDTKSDNKEVDQNKVDPNEVKREALKKARERLEDGEEFAKIAMEITEDENAKASGGDMGIIEFGDITGPLQEPLKKLDDGEYSEIVETEDAFYIGFLEERQEGQLKPLEEVRAILENEIRQEEAPLYASDAASEFLNSCQSKTGEKLEDIAKAQNLAVATLSEPLLEDQDPPATEHGLTKAVINKEEGKIDLIELGDKSYVVQVSNFYDSHIPEFKDIKEKVVADYKKQEALKTAKEEAKKIQAALLALVNAKNQATPDEQAAGQEQKAPQVLSLDSISEQFKLEAEDTSTVTRASAIKTPFNISELKKAAFLLTDKQPVPEQFFEHEGTFYFIQLKETKVPSKEDYESAKSSLISSESSSAKNRLMSALISNLKAHSDVWVDPAVTTKSDTSVDNY